MTARALRAAALLLSLVFGCASGDAGDRRSASAVPPAASTEAIPSGAMSSAASASPSASASAAQKDKGPLAGQAMWKDVTWLAAPERKGRGSGTDDEGVARDWLVTQLKGAALEPEVQPFSFRRFKSANVIATITPPAPHKPQPILIGAHYDHVGVRKGKLYPGAEDNASGTAMVLAVARALVARRSELSRPVIVVFFGAEEAGLHGSDAFAAKWDFKQRPLHAMINIDMIGRPLVDQPGLWLAASLVGVLSDVDPDQAVGVVLPEPPGEIADLAKEACKEAGVRAITIADLPPKLRPMLEEMSRGRSDHAAFEKRGVPFAFFSSGESSDYHQPTDTADKVDPKILEQRADAVLRLVLKLAR